MVERRFRVERFLGAAAMAALCVITLANVLVRYFTDISFAFTEEVSVFLMVFLTFVGSAKAFLDGNQIAVTWFAERAPGVWRHRLLLLSFACVGADGRPAGLARRAHGVGRFPLRGHLARDRRAAVAVHGVAAAALARALPAPRAGVSSSCGGGVARRA